MFRCPDCGQRMAGRPMATSFTATVRTDRYWCDHCMTMQRASTRRDYEQEDMGHDTTPRTTDRVMWSHTHGAPTVHIDEARAA